MSSEIVVGIDLGTTNSCIAYYDGQDRPVLIPDNEGNTIIPSLVYFNPLNGEVFVGEEAYRKSVKCPSNLIKDSKRFMGRAYNDEFVQRYSTSQNNLKLVKGKNEMAAFGIQVNGTEVIKMPEEISAEILRYLMNMAKQYFGKEARKAVISVPAYFSNSQKNATKNAAELIGLHVMRLITEPTAGAVNYLKDKNCVSRTMVFDWGGGTLDISFLEVRDNNFKVVAVYGDSLLGGRDIDEKLCQFFKFTVTRHADKFQRTLTQACVRLKKKLATCQEAEEEVAAEDQEFKLNMTRQQFDDLLKDVFERVSDVVRTALEDSGWSESQVDQVVLVGGSSRIFRVREILKSIFGNDKLKFNLNPDEAVACGASVQACLLGNSKLLESFKITEVTPLSLGIDVGTDLFSVIISKKSQLPISRTKRFITSVNDQIALNIAVYEGVRKMNKYNNKLGELKIKNLPPKRAGDVKIDVNFSLDDDGILRITAKEATMGSTSSMSITMSEYRLSERKIDCSVLEAKNHKHEDDVFEEFNLRRNDLKKVFNHIIYDLNKITDASDRQTVEAACDNFIELATNLDFTEIDKLEAKFKIIYESIQDLLSKYNMIELPEITGITREKNSEC